MMGRPRLPSSWAFLGEATGWAGGGGRKLGSARPARTPWPGPGLHNPRAVMRCRKPELLVHEDRVKERNVALIKRFTGGGTVVVDRDTIFTGLIMNVDAVEGLTPYPRPIMRWTEHLFDPVFRRYGDFALREHGTEGQGMWLMMSGGGV